MGVQISKNVDLISLERVSKSYHTILVSSVSPSDPLICKVHNRQSLETPSFVRSTIDDP